MVTILIDDRDNGGKGYNIGALLAVSVVTFFQFGSVKAFGVFIPEFTEHLSLSVSTVGVIGGINIGLRCILGKTF